MVHIHNGILLRQKMSVILPLVTARTGMMLNEITQTEKDKHHMISLICGI